jgi:hypothetical protein
MVRLWRGLRRLRCVVAFLPVDLGSGARNIPPRAREVNLNHGAVGWCSCWWERLGVAVDHLTRLLSSLGYEPPVTTP